ncbi:MAG: hypothetical protein C5B59_18335 [Bacteroidetes bacterium]|nr:MAG: hypothetical protein C5B59_18335 [Bacteroidota bacterium]
MSFFRKKDDKKKDVGKNISYEEALKMGLNPPTFRKIPLSEMADKKGQIWEVKLTIQEETIFGVVIGVEEDCVYFDQILNFKEVESNKKLPQIKNKKLTEDEIEAVRLTNINL